RKCLPKNQATLVALVVGILYRIDSMQLNILDMLKNYYPNEDTTISYPKFTNEWLVPFVDVINYLAFGQPYEEYSQPKAQSNDQLQKDIEIICRDIIRKINTAKCDDKDCLLTLCNGLVYSLKISDNILIKVAYLGLINSLDLYKINCDEELDEILSILKIYGVL
ncbi:MAG: hypothetical protein WCR54_02520, partial [Clostridia bacterium]